jgi:hypothetical protein
MERALPVPKSLRQGARARSLPRAVSSPLPPIIVRLAHFAPRSPLLPRPMISESRHIKQSREITLLLDLTPADPLPSRGYSGSFRLIPEIKFIPPYAPYVLDILARTGTRPVSKPPVFFVSIATSERIPSRSRRNL